MITWPSIPLLPHEITEIIDSQGQRNKAIMGRGVQLLFGCLHMGAVSGMGGARGGGTKEAQLCSPEEQEVMC